MKAILLILLILTSLPSLADDAKDKKQDHKAKEVEAIVEKSDELVIQGKIDESLALCLKASQMLKDVKETVYVGKRLLLPSFSARRIPPSEI